MISVIIPVFNEDLKDLKKSVDSILGQTEQNFELIIILDNPNNFEMDFFLKEYSKNDHRIKYFKNDENLGIGMTLNKGIENSKFDLIARLDADDISLPTRLEKQYKFLQGNPNIAMVTTNCVYIDENDKEIGVKGQIPENDEEIKLLLPLGSTIIHSSVMYRKSAVNSVGNYRKLLNCQDYDLWLRMIDSNLKIASMDEPLTKYRIRTNSITMSNALRSMLTEQYVRKLHKERLSNGQDSFTFESYLSYLKKNGCEDEKKKNNFLLAINKYNDGINALQSNNKIKGIKAIFSSLNQDKIIFKKIVNMVKYRNMRKKILRGKINEK